MTAASGRVWSAREWQCMTEHSPNMKAIFFDIDGTLLSHKLGDVPASARRSIEALRAKGIRCLIASGRHREEIRRLPVKNMTFDGYLTLNGQLCMDANGEIFSAEPITGIAKERILEAFHSKETAVMLVEKDTMYLNLVNDRVRKAQADISTPIPPLGIYTGNPLYQAVVYLDSSEEVSFLKKIQGCTITRWNPNGIDLISSSGGKEAGIRAYLDRMGIRREETMAFGDAQNDLRMLSYVGIGVAMGDATPEIQSQADYVTASVEEDCIEKALKYFGLI